jgi:hypothetical protein
MLDTVVQLHVRKPQLLNTTRTQKIKRNQYTLCLSLHKLKTVSLKPMIQTSSNPPSHTTLTLIWTQCWQGAFLRAPVSLMKDHHTVGLHLLQRGIKEKKCVTLPCKHFLTMFSGFIAVSQSISLQKLETVSLEPMMQRLHQFQLVIQL